MSALPAHQLPASPAFPADQGQLFLDSLPQLAWIARADGAVTWCNRRWRDYTGLGAEQTAGDGWQAALDPATVGDVLAHWRDCVAATRPFERELHLRGADGRHRPFLTRAEPVRDAAGTVLWWIGTHTDLSAHRASEATLRLALESAYLVAWVWEIPSNQVWRYHNADEMFRRTTDQPDTFEAIHAMVHAEDQCLFDANVQAALRDPQGRYCSEFRITGQDGKLRWLLERGRAEFGGDGRPLRLIGFSQDITDRKNAELKLMEAQIELQRHAVQLESAVAERTARLQELVNELGTFSYSISHDLRAPLRSIQGFAELLREEAGEQLPPGSQSHLDRIIRAAQRMDALIRDVLAYSRITRAELTIEEVDPAEIVREAIETQQALQPPSSRIEIVGPLPRVQASRPALMQCLSNLLGNAVKFVAKGVTPEVRVRGESDGGMVRLWIEDNGIGIAPENHDKIWGMLERLNAGYEGTGVGLSIVRKGVERMGGRVGVQSALGQGSRFWIELPAAR